MPSLAPVTPRDEETYLEGRDEPSSVEDEDSKPTLDLKVAEETEKGPGRSSEPTPELSKRDKRRAREAAKKVAQAEESSEEVSLRDSPY